MNYTHSCMGIIGIEWYMIKGQFYGVLLLYKMETFIKYARSRLQQNLNKSS